MRPSRASISIWLTALALTVFPAFAQEVQHGRVSYVDDDGLIKGTEDEEWSIAQMNSLVMPGDTIWADEDGVLEVEVSGGSFVRLADGSKIDVASMPPDARVRAYTGSFYIHRLRQSEGDFTLETPVGDVQVGYDAQVRVDILDEGATTVTVRWGNAVIHSGGTSTRVNSGHRVYIDPGYLPSEPEQIDRGREDAFDAWNRERSRSIARGASRNTIGNAGSYSTPIGAYDLDEYGEWISVDNQRYWRPTVIREYVPYRVGTWSYVPRHGHVWVGHHPFTYITSHHGHWSHHHRHGWIWSYNRVYSPAYVASVRYDDVFIWAPLGVHGDAVHVSGSYFTAGGFHFSIGFSTYTSASHYLGGHHHHVYPVHHHHHIHHHNHYNAHHWNHYDHRSHHYRHRPKRRYHDRDRDYTPQRVMRGPSSVAYTNRTIHAGNRAIQLESRLQSTGGRASARTQDPTNRIRTASVPSNRSARARNVAFQQDARTRITNLESRLRSVPGDGSKKPFDLDNGRMVVDRRLTRNVGDDGNGRGGNRTLNSVSDAGNRPNSRPGATTIRPNTSDTNNRPNGRPGVSTIRPNTSDAGNRPNTSDTNNRPNGRTGVSTIRPNTSDTNNRPNTRPDVTTIRPNTSDLNNRPTVRPERPGTTTDTSRERRVTTLNNRSATDADKSVLHRVPRTTRPEPTTTRRTVPNSSSSLNHRSSQTDGPMRIQPQRPSSSGTRTIDSRLQNTAPRESTRSTRTVTPQPRSQQLERSRPNVSTSRPNVSTSRPNVSTSRPNVSTSRPNVSTSRPNVSTSRPSASSTRSTAPRTRSQVSNPQPSRPTYTAPRSSSSSSSNRITTSPSRSQSSISTDNSRSSGRSSVSSGSSRSSSRSSASSGSSRAPSRSIGSSRGSRSPR